MYSFRICSSPRFDVPLLASICALYRNALAKACPFDLGSLRVGVALFGPVSPGSWPGVAWVPWRALPWTLLFLVASCDPGS